MNKLFYTNENKLSFIKSTILILVVFPVLAFAGTANLPTAPIPPVDTCDVDFPLATNPVQHNTCKQTYQTNYAAYQTQLSIYQGNEQLWNYISDPNKAATLDANGRLILPNAPVNDCGQYPAGSPAAINCNANFTSATTAYQKAQTAYNSINAQMITAGQTAVQVNDLKAQQNGQAQAGARLEYINENSATSTLDVVWKNNKEATSMYSVSSFILSGFSRYNNDEGDVSSNACSSTDYNSCTDAVGGYAASAAFSDMSSMANDQVLDLGLNQNEICVLKNKLSENKTPICNFTSTMSPSVIPAIATPPTPAWFDPFTAQCRSTAPELCKEILNLISTGGNPANSLIPVSTRRCPDGGTSCVTSDGPTVQVTPQGTKYTFKDKKGKSYSFYSSDFKDEKSMIKAGLSPAQAKKLKKNLETKSAEALVAAKKVAQKLSEIHDAKNGVNSGFDNKMVFEHEVRQKNAVVAGKPTAASVEITPAQKLKQMVPVAGVRRPASKGLSRNLNGDLIGVAEDNIFEMINLRYKRKSEMNWFYTP